MFFFFFLKLREPKFSPFSHTDTLGTNEVEIQFNIALRRWFLHHRLYNLSLHCERCENLNPLEYDLKLVGIVVIISLCNSCKLQDLCTAELFSVKVYVVFQSLEAEKAWRML